MDNIKPIAEYPAKILQIIGSNKTILSLISNNSNIDPESEEAEQIVKNHLFDYGYVDDTVQENGAFICVETELIRPISDTFFRWTLYISVYCHKNYMKLDPTIFPKMLGNRRDNIVKAIEDVIGGEMVLGLGKLQLTSVNSVTSPKAFASREMKYSIPEFARTAR